MSGEKPGRVGKESLTGRKILLAFLLTVSPIICAGGGMLGLSHHLEQNASNKVLRNDQCEPNVLGQVIIPMVKWAKGNSNVARELISDLPPEARREVTEALIDNQDATCK